MFVPGRSFQPNLMLSTFFVKFIDLKIEPGNTKGESITAPLTSCLTGLESAVCLLAIFVFICKTD